MPLLAGIAIALAGRRAYSLWATGALTLDVGVGRRTRPLGPVTWAIQAPRETVFDVISEPYLSRTPRALQQKLQVWERGWDMVLAAHFTPVKHRVTTTVETVHFERPQRVSFRLVRGPVPHLRETFTLTAVGAGTELTWEGDLGTDFWALGEYWGERVSRFWEYAVRASLDAITAEAERRAAKQRR